MAGQKTLKSCEENILLFAAKKNYEKKEKTGKVS